MPGGFDWPALLRLGFHALGLEPARFWALTPAELRLLLGQGATARPMSRQGLEELARAFPDRVAAKGDCDGGN